MDIRQYIINDIDTMRTNRHQQVENNREYNGESINTGYITNEFIDISEGFSHLSNKRAESLINSLNIMDTDTIPTVDNDINNDTRITVGGLELNFINRDAEPSAPNNEPNHSGIKP
jgi:hypothetical protein